MEIINLVPHEVNIIDKNNECVNIPASGNIARVNYDKVEIGEINGIPVYSKEYKDINFSTIIKPYVIYIVSNEIIKALKALSHPSIHQFVAPNTINPIRDTDGKILSVNGFMV